MKPEWRFDHDAVPVPMAGKLINILMRDQPCWRVTRVLGSMLVFDFGERQTVTSKRGTSVQVGSEQLSIRNVQWSASGGEIGRVTSDNLDSSRMEQMCGAFSGAALEGCQRKGGRLSFGFSGGLKLSLDLTNRYEIEADEDIAEFRMKGGLSLSLSREGVFGLRAAYRPIDSGRRLDAYGCMTRRKISTERLIAVLGVAVVVLGALILWLVTRAGVPEEPSPEARARVQVREHLGPQARISYTEQGRRLAVCGYITDGDEVIAFISRPNRLMLDTDPLKAEFRQLQGDLCPGFLIRRPAIR